ncbi:MAG: hypothetical protein ACIAQU_01305, partial [Phycisphaerales bacterium JB064]
MFQPIANLVSRLWRGSSALASSHFAHPGSHTMAILLALGLIVSLTAASCQWPNRTRAVLGPAEGAYSGWEV